MSVNKKAGLSNKSVNLFQYEQLHQPPSTTMKPPSTTMKPLSTTMKSPSNHHQTTINHHQIPVEILNK